MKRRYLFQHPSDYNVKLLINTLSSKEAGQIPGSLARWRQLGADRGEETIIKSSGFRPNSIRFFRKSGR